jgi:hypothetical protein
MNNNPNLYNIVNRVIKDKVFQYEGPFVSGAPDFKIKCSFKIELVGDVELLHMGEPRNHVGVKVYITEFTPHQFSDLLDKCDTRNKCWDRSYHFTRELTQYIWRVLQHFSINDDPSIESIEYIGKKYDPFETNPEMIKETKSEKRNVVRKVVEDIVRVFKTRGEGDYLLPEDISEEITYNFHNLKTEFNLELTIIKSDEIEDYELDGGYYDDEDTMEIEIIYNENAFPQKMYDLVGSLNETVRHELQHLIQSERGDYKPSNPTNNPKKYYVQPHELDAQVAGLKRISKIRKQPFEQSAREWFAKNKSKHTLDDKHQEKVIQRILQYYKDGK